MPDAPLQFEKPEYATGSATCSSCTRPIQGPHYMAGTKTICPSCRDQIVAHLNAPVGAAGYVKALSAGLGAGLLGAIGWGAIRAATGYEIGLVAIAVGWGVSKAMRWGAGRGGRVLQFASLAISYFAIAASYVPELASGMANGEPPVSGPVAWLVAIPMSMAIPYFVIQGGASAILWFVIVGIALRRAWLGLYQPTADFIVGPIGA